MVNTELVQDFVNSRELRPAVEELETPKHLSAWLCERGLLEPGARVTKADLAEAMRVREALRDVLSAKVGIEVDLDAAKAEIDAAARRAGLELRFDPTCPRVEPTVGGVRGAIGRILVEVYDEMVDGIWERMKACKADDCRWAFLDTSKNKSRAWCSMESCGNRAKVHAYRQRHQHYPAHPTTSHTFGAEPAQTRSQVARTVVSNDNERRERAQSSFAARARGGAGVRRCRRGCDRLSGRVRRTCDPGGGTPAASRSRRRTRRASGRLLDQARPGRLVLQAERRHHEHLDRGALLRRRRPRLVLRDRRVEDGRRRRLHTWATFEAHAQWTVTPLHIYNNTDVLGLTVPTIDG